MDVTDRYQYSNQKRFQDTLLLIQEMFPISH